MTVNGKNQINSVSGLSYDANGNQNVGGYDVENRLTSANGLQYGYDGQNKRIWSWAGAVDPNNNTTNFTVSVYTPSGQKLGAYLLAPAFVQNSQTGFQVVPSMQVTLSSSDTYFGSRRLGVIDQLGSAGTYYPWGEPKGTTNPQNTWSFATYWQDSNTGLDYANNRYYANAYGRFMTPDPYTNSGRLTAPQSWNRYAYTAGDPVSRVDPTGTDWCDIDWGLYSSPPDCVLSGSSTYPITFDTTAISAAIAAATAALVAWQQQQTGAAAPFPKYLLVTGDCDYTSGLTGGQIRRRTYEVLDQNFQPMGNGISVQENISNVTPSSNTITGGGVWSTGEGGGAPAGSFYDFYSNGTNSSPSNSLQTYTVIYQGVPYPLIVLEPDNFSGNPSTYSQYGTQGVYYAYNGVKIDGYYTNPIVGSKSPCAPPTPGLP